jgi:hypothetical protein
LQTIFSFLKRENKKNKKSLTYHIVVSYKEDTPQIYASNAYLYVLLIWRLISP